VESIRTGCGCRSARKRAALKRSRISPISKKRRLRSGIAGKLGIVRLYGKDMAELRHRVYERDAGRCQFVESNGFLCGKRLPFDGSVFVRAHLAHIVGRGRGGSDTAENTRLVCYFHHIVCEHSGGKPCPPKPKPEELTHET